MDFTLRSSEGSVKGRNGTTMAESRPHILPFAVYP